MSSLKNRWYGMMSRCYNVNDTGYPSYGLVGVTVEARWHYFENFATDVGVPPQGYVLDRLNGRMPYGQYNWRWCTPEQNGVNKIKYTEEEKALRRFLREEFFKMYPNHRSALNPAWR